VDKQRDSIVVRPGLLLTLLLLSCALAGSVIYWLLHSMRV
jgi:hypothetical protein